MSNDFWEAYKRPEWQQKRLEIMQSANFTCQDCGDKEKTQNVHHSYYIKGRMLWEYPNEDLRCLCEDCHEARELFIREIRKQIGSLPIGRVEQIYSYTIGLTMKMLGRGRAHPKQFGDSSGFLTCGIGDAFSVSNQSEFWDLFGTQEVVLFSEIEKIRQELIERNKELKTDIEEVSKSLSKCNIVAG